MAIAHGASRIGLLVDGEEHLDARARIVAKVVPFIGSLPILRQTPGRWMAKVDDLCGCPLNGWMTVEVCANQISIPGPVIFCIRCRVNADKSSSLANESFQGCLLVDIEDVSAGV